MRSIAVPAKTAQERLETSQMEEKKQREEREEIGTQRREAKRKWTEALGQREQADCLLRDALARLEVSRRNPDIPARERILQADLLDSLVIYRPASRREFIAKIPALLRERIHPAEIKHLDAILVLCRGARK